MVPTVREVAQGLRDAYRHSEDAGRTILDVSLLNSGFETDIFGFSLAPVNGGEKAQNCILRLYAGDGTAEKAAREFAVMRRLHDVGYPVPTVQVVETAHSPFGRPFLIMERIPGVSVGSIYWSAAEHQRPELLITLMRLMHRLHQLEPTDLLPESPLEQVSDPNAGLTSELAALAELLNRLAPHEPPSLHKVLAWLHCLRATVSCDRLSVVHGDFHPNNVLLCADGTAYVIDWSNVRLSDYRMDLAWTRLIVRADDLPDRGEAALGLYARFTSKPIRDLAYFDVIACTRLVTSVLISLRFGAARQGMRPEATALMRGSDDHTRYEVTVVFGTRFDTLISDLTCVLVDIH